MTRYIVAALAAVVAGCASTGVVPMDKGTFMIAKDMGPPGATGARMLADLYVEANAFCASSSRTIETISTEDKDNTPFVRAASAKLVFRCVDSK